MSLLLIAECFEVGRSFWRFSDPAQARLHRSSRPRLCSDDFWILPLWRYSEHPCTTCASAQSLLQWTRTSWCSFGAFSVSIAVLFLLFCYLSTSKKSLASSPFHPLSVDLYTNEINHEPSLGYIVQVSQTFLMIPSLHNFLGSLQQLIQYDYVSCTEELKTGLSPGLGLLAVATLFDTTQDPASLFCSQGHIAGIQSNWCSPGLWAAFQLVNCQWILGDWGCSLHVEDSLLWTSGVPVSLFLQQPIYSSLLWSLNCCTNLLCGAASYLFWSV